MTIEQVNEEIMRRWQGKLPEGMSFLADKRGIFRLALVYDGTYDYVAYLVSPKVQYVFWKKVTLSIMDLSRRETVIEKIGKAVVEFDNELAKGTAEKVPLEKAP